LTLEGFLQPLLAKNSSKLVFGGKIIKALQEKTFTRKVRALALSRERLENKGIIFSPPFGIRLADKRRALRGHRRRYA
jgi:hypothetical protein